SIERTEEQRKQVAGAMTRFLNDFAALHKVEVGNHVAPALHFNADPWHPPVAYKREPMPAVQVDPKLERPEADEDLAFLPLAKLAGLVRAKKVSSTELTKLYLDRPKEFDPAL